MLLTTSRKTKSIGKILSSLLLIGMLCFFTQCGGPCDGDCKSSAGLFCCPNPSGPGGTCCISGKQVCASTGGEEPGPKCEDIPLEEQDAKKVEKDTLAAVMSKLRAKPTN
jgi:hypothetical protein